MPPPASRPDTPAEDMNLALQAMACPAFRFGHLMFGGHGLRWIASRKDGTGTPQGAAGQRPEQPAQHGEMGTRP